MRAGAILGVARHGMAVLGSGIECLGRLYGWIGSRIGSGAGGGEVRAFTGLAPAPIIALAFALAVRQDIAQASPSCGQPSPQPRIIDCCEGLLVLLHRAG